MTLWCDQFDMSALPSTAPPTADPPASWTIAFTGVLAVVLVAAGVVLYTEFERDLDGVIDQDLNTAWRTCGRFSAKGAIRATRSPRAARASAQLYAADGQVLASTRQVSPGRAAHAPRGCVEPGAAGGPGWTGALRHPAMSAYGPPVLARAAARARRRRGGIARAARPVLAACAICSSSRVLWRCSSQATPATRWRAQRCDQSRRMHPRRADHRPRHGRALPVPASNDEIEALGHTFNELLARLDAALARERRLLSDASHELRTPLTVLRTGIQVALRRERDARELREALESAGREAGRVSRLAEDLLVLARADPGRLPIRGEPLDVGSWSEAAAARAAPPRARPGGRSGPRWGREGAIALTDADRAGQALDNLVANALAHGGGEVRVVGREVDERVELHVTDEGEGFPKLLRTLSNASARAIGPARARAPASASRSWRPSPAPTMATWAPATCRAAAPTSGSRFPLPERTPRRRRATAPGSVWLSRPSGDSRPRAGSRSCRRRRGGPPSRAGSGCTRR